MRVNTLSTVVVAGGLLSVGSGPPACATVAHYVCTNPDSAATWDVQVDFDRGEVDGQPAQITER